MSGITNAIEHQGIPIEVISRRSHFRRVTSVVVRVPLARLAEAIVALELQGYSDVIGYHAGEN